jgi:serine/threonine protein kinase
MHSEYSSGASTNCVLLLDVKPDNILVDWALDEQGKPPVKRAALGGFDIALKLESGSPLRAKHAVGNVMWQSPKGQTGKGVAKPSDVYSFGLVVCKLGSRVDHSF